MLESKIQPKTITDFSGFQSLKNAAQHHDPKAAKAVAKQFEALFLQMMLKDMRKASGSFGDTLLKSDEEEYFTEMFDKQIALQMANGRGMGLAQVIEKQLTKQSNYEVTPEKMHDITGIPANTVNQSHLRANLKQTEKNSEDKKDILEKLSFTSPDEFIKNLMPLAKEFATKLGVKPELLVAQAALETGWGKTINDKSFNNLFGIKSTNDWQGKSVSKNTLEFENGVLNKKSEPFRVYDTIRESFADYVDFIKGNQRYQDVLKNAHSPEAFAQGLQEAGYATDPDYAKKILQIYEKIG